MRDEPSDPSPGNAEGDPAPAPATGAFGPALSGFGRSLGRWFPMPEGEMRDFGRLLTIYSVLGVLVGLIATGFQPLVEWSTAQLVGPFTGELTSELTWPGLERLWLLLIPALGGLVVGLACARIAPEVMGPGIGPVIEAYLTRDGKMRRRVPAMKLFASTVTLGTGGSGGVEGPIGQIAAGVGAWFGRATDVSRTDRRVLTMAGFAAGVGAVFHAPMAAAILAAEILYRQMDIEHEVLVPAIIASTVAHAVYGALGGWSPLLAVPPVDFSNGLQLIPYLILAVALAITGLAFIQLIRFVRRHLGRSGRYPLWLRPALGGLTVGMIGLFVPHVLGSGYGIIELALSGRTMPWVLLIFALAKMVASAATSGSGGSAGLFAPSLIVGGALGGVIGEVTAELAPALGVEPAAFVVVGMAGLFAAVSNAPLSTVIMVSEIIGSYRLVVPALWVCVLAWLLTRRVTLFPEQVNSRLDARFRVADAMGAVLHRITVHEALAGEPEDPVTVPPDLPLRDLVRVFSQSHQAVFPIRSADGRLMGVVDGRQLRATIAQTDMSTLLLAGDFQAPALTIGMSDTLHDAIARMSASGYDDLLVVDDDDPERLLGLLSRRQVVGAYHRRMLERAPGQPEEATEQEVILNCDLGAALHRGRLHRVGGDTPEAVLRALVAEAALPDACDRDELITLLLEREALGSTGVGDGIAMPHPHAENLAGITHPIVIVGLLTAPVPWGSFDDKPVDIVAVLLCPSGDVHLKLLGQLARVLLDPETRDLLRHGATLPKVLKRVWDVVPPE